MPSPRPKLQLLLGDMSRAFWMQSSTLLCHTPSFYFWPLLRDPIACAKYQPLVLQSTYSMRTLRLSYSIFGSSTTRLQSLREYPATIDVRELSPVGIDSDSNFLANLHFQPDEDEDKVGDHNHFPCSEVTRKDPREIKETQRRIKIGLANKGKIPWNKGRKHTAETRAKIKQRTIEAMRNPKVRRKMSEAPRRHSEQNKVKISLSLRRLWAERLKWKRVREHFHSLWAESIAEASRKGGIGEEELNWNAYERLKEERAAQLLMVATEREKKKEIKSIQAKRRAHAREEKMARLEQKKIEREQKAEARAERKRRMHQQVKGEKEELKLVARLTKIQRKKSVICSPAGIISSYGPSLERLDFEIIEKEQMRSKVSFADQIRAAKTRRVESTTMESLATSVDRA